MYIDMVLTYKWINAVLQDFVWEMLYEEQPS